MSNKRPILKWLILIIGLLFLLIACNQGTPGVEPTAPALADPTDTPTLEPPQVEQATPTETATPDNSAEVPEISQPISRWNAVSEQENWILIGYGDALNPPVVEPNTYVTINFSSTADQVSGSGGCNNFSATYTADDDGSLTINSPLGSTLMACETGMEQEGLYFSALETVTGYTVTENGTLLLDYDSGTVYDEQLVFIPEKPFVETIWVLTAYGDPNNLSPSNLGVTTTAVFSANGTVKGFTGCNNFIANYSLEGNQITINLPVINLATCETGMEQEQIFLQLLETAQSYRIGANALEIVSNDGTQRMQFEALNLSLENVRWQLKSIDGLPLPADISVNALFTPATSSAAMGADNTVNGSAGCNNFFGPYTLSGDSFSAGPFGLTRMICAEFTMQIEQAFLSGLENVESYQIIGSHLEIQTVNGLLRFLADRYPLEGPQWILTGSGPIDNPQPPIPDAVFTAEFSRQFGMPSGIKSGETGCNNYTATYFAAADHMKVNLPKTSQITCSDAQLEAEQGYFLGLNAARDYRILGNELYIYYDDSVLIFVGNYPAANVGPLRPLDGTLWRLTFIDDSVVVPGSEVTIAFAINSDGFTGAISGSGGCNTYTAEITGAFTLGGINLSRALCDSPEGVMEQETAYINALQYANSMMIEGSTLKITTSYETLYFSRGILRPATPTPTPGAPTAVIVAPSNENVGVTITYDGSLSTSGAEITSFSWWFTGDQFEEGVKVQRIYNKIGAYDAILTITDATGQKSETSIKTKIHPYLVGSSWISDNERFTLSFSGGSLSGNAGCNDYSAGYTANSAPGKTNDLSVDSITQTGKECGDDVMDREKAYLSSLENATSYIINLNQMTITTSGGSLNFYLTSSSP